MMEKFRNLSHNIFFKIFLAFLGLTFVLFGISGFLLSSGGSWIAKVGSKKIDYKEFVNIVQNQREAISRVNSSKEALQYLDSDQFRQDVLGQMITKQLIKDLQNEYQIYPDENLILQAIAKSPSLQQDGKFSRELYQNFLHSNHLTEKEHISQIKDEIAGNIIVQALAETAPISENLAKTLYQYRAETRNADIISITTNNIGNISAPNVFELTDFFDKHKAQFSLPEMRKVSYMYFDKSALNQPIKVSDEEISKEYNSNIADYQIPETRSFYQILFSDEKEAKEFLATLKSDSQDPNSNKGDVFVKLALAKKHKDKNAILLSNISKKDLPSEIASSTFSLAKNQYSDVLKSQLGFHIFYLLDITPSSQIALSKAKDQIRTKLIANKQENQLGTELTAIEDELITTNSLEKTAKKFHLSVNKNLVKFSANGIDAKQQTVAEIKDFEQFAENSFKLNKNQASKLFFSSKNNKYYAILVEEVEAGRQRSLDEVKVLATDLWIQNRKQQKLQEFAENITKAINVNHGDASAIVAKNHLQIEKNHLFPRFYMVNAGNGRTIPYADKMLNEIFTLKLNQASNPHLAAKDKAVVVVVRNIKTPAVNDKIVQEIRQDLENSFKNDILTEYSQYIKKKYPVQVNQKLLKTSDKDNNGQ